MGCLHLALAKSFRDIATKDLAIDIVDDIHTKALSLISQNTIIIMYSYPFAC
jgi:hypothetical protein